jgi:hypothetical protein
MNDPPVSPAPLVEQALQSLRAAALDRTGASPDGATAPSEATSAPEVQAEPASKAEPEPQGARAKRRPPQGKVDAAPSESEADPEPSESEADPEPTEVEADTKPVVALDAPRTGSSSPLDSAMEALRMVSVSAQTRLADPQDFPMLPLERDLPDLGPYVEHVMRQAQAAAAAYREEAAREAATHATKLLDNATELAEKVRQDADAYTERARAHADALLAHRVQRIAELTGRLSKMAQLAGDEFTDDKKMRDQMMQFVSGLAGAAEEAVSEVFPDAAS